MTSSEPLVDWVADGPIALLTIDNPPLNVLSNAVRSELNRCAREIAATDAVRAVVIRGAGGRAFSVGSDIREFDETMQPSEGRARARREHGQYNRLAHLGQPVVAAIEGFCLGGGFELALACDLRIAAEQSRFALPEVRLGLFPSGGGTERLPEIVGRAKAKEIMFLGEQFSAQEAYALGIVNRVVPTGEASAAALALARQIAERPAAAVRAIKRLVDAPFQADVERRLEEIMDVTEAIYQTDDAREGRAAFLEKRAPRFRHR